MRLLVIGHTYMTALGQAKLRALRDIHPDVDILVACPRWWPDPLFELTATAVREDRLQVRPLPTYAPGYGSRYAYGWHALGRLMARFDPDVVQVDHEPHALATLQVLALRRVAAARAAVSLFTWDNVADAPHGLGSRVRSLLRRRAFRSIDLLMAGNHAAVPLARARGFAGPIVLIPQIGVDPAPVAPEDVVALRSELGVDSGFVIGFVGRLAREKGLLTLAAALAQLTERWTLLVVGDGGLRDELEARLVADGLASRVRWLGAVPHGAVPRLMGCMDALVLPSERMPTWQEQFGHVLIEAMACGVPVVGTASGEIPHVIGDAGLVVPEHNAAALARALARLMSDRDLRELLRLRGRARVERHYSHPALGGQLGAAYWALRKERGVAHGVCAATCNAAE